MENQITYRFVNEFGNTIQISVDGSEDDETVCIAIVGPQSEMNNTVTLQEAKALHNLLGLYLNHTWPAHTVRDASCKQQMDSRTDQQQKRSRGYFVSTDCLAAADDVDNEVGSEQRRNDANE